MPCCVAEKYGNWCADVEEVVTHEGKEYCIFHAPAECKEKQDLEGFNIKIFNKIDTAIEQGNKCDLRGVIFPGSIKFSQYDTNKPLPPIHFDYAFFHGSADFDKTVFSDRSYFRKASFSGKTIFHEVLFKKYASFSNSTFEQYVSFRGSDFGRSAVFVNTKFLAGVSFKYVEFSMPCYFRGGDLGNAHFSVCFAHERLEFESARLEKVNFHQAPIESCRFIDCTWPAENARNVIYDGRHFFPFSRCKEPDKRKVKPSLGQLADTYRRLKKVALIEKDNALASDWHYNQKEMERINAFENKNRLMAAVLWIYKQIAGYGEAPWRAAMFLLVLLALPILAAHPEHYYPFVKTTGMESDLIFFKLFHGIYRLAITIQAGLFALALRNKLRR
jgi:uncharacterized protein YjbI with pentapeptide repeats